MTFIEDKGVLASKTVWGGVVAVLPLVLEIVQKFGVASGIATTPELTAAVSGIGGLIAIIGRLKAKKTIGGLFS